MRSVFASDFGIWPTFQNIHHVSDAMVSSLEQREALADYLLLYDQIFIPTGNFQILPVLRLLLGEDVFDELIKTKSIVLVRYDKWFGYMGGDQGLKMFSIHEGDHNPRPLSMGLAYFRDLEEAIDAALKTTTPIKGPERRGEIKELLLGNVIEAPFERLTERLVEITNADVAGSPYLRALFNVSSKGFSGIVKGVKPNTVIVYDPHTPPGKDTNKKATALLKIAFENLMLGFSGFSSVSDICSTPDSLTILQAKGQRLGRSIVGRSAFAQMLQVHGIPQLGKAFAHREISPRQLLDIRNSSKTQLLRNWLSKFPSNTSEEEVIAKYVEELGRGSAIERLPYKILRFVVTNALGWANPIIGGVAGVADNFLLSRWMPDKSPRLFMKQAKTLMDEIRKRQSPSVQPQKLSPNAPCHCGSGKKYKKCCGF